MAAQGRDILARLDAHCLGTMQIELKRALILHLTLSTEAISTRELASESTIKNRLRIARAEIALALDETEPLTPRLCGYWIGNHCGDCLKDAVAQLKGS